LLYRKSRMTMYFGDEARVVLPAQYAPRLIKRGGM
jgi:hypothetical protein